MSALARAGAKIHPVVLAVFKNLVPGPDKERYALSAPLIGGLYKTLLKAKKQLPALVCSLRAMAKAAKEEWRSPTLAEQIRRLLALPEIAKVLRRAKVSVDAETVSKTADLFRRFMGDEVRRSARHLDEKPDGALSLAQLGIPRRI